MHPMEQNDFQHIATMLRPRLISLCQQFFDCQELAFDAEDAVQETLLRLWQLRDRMEDYQRPEALATIIAKNVCINILKRGGTQHDVLDERLCIEASSKTDQTVIVQDAERRITDWAGSCQTSKDPASLVENAKRRDVHIRNCNGL